MKEIKLGGKKGGVALVDDEDFERISKYSWQKCTDGYAITTIRDKGKRKTVGMHRIVMNCYDKKQVHHKDHNKLNNQKYNLIICNHKQNMFSKEKRFDSKWNYKGILKVGNKWRAVITAESKCINIGYYYTEEEAAHAYDFYALKYHGEFAWLNFPDFNYSNYDYTKGKINKPQSSKYKYICAKDNGRYCIYTYVGETHKSFGTFETELEAITHYNNVVAPLLGRQPQKIVEIPEIQCPDKL